MEHISREEAPKSGSTPAQPTLATASTASTAEPVDPCHKLPTRTLSSPSVPVRSLLTPSQRAQLRSQDTPRESGSRPAYVTYTIAPKS
jgi:hypothetical protein